MSESADFVKLPTRAECTEILISRGYVPADYPGVWLDFNGEKIAWFNAVKRENLEFDRKDKIG